MAALQRAGHDVVATDLAEPEFDHFPPGTPDYVKADLTDAGQAARLLGWRATRSWRDHLTDDGEPR